MPSVGDVGDGGSASAADSPDTADTPDAGSSGSPFDSPSGGSSSLRPLKSSSIADFRLSLGAAETPRRGLRAAALGTAPAEAKPPGERDP